jgi:hypothetical protein
MTQGEYYLCGYNVIHEQARQDYDATWAELVISNQIQLV